MDNYVIYASYGSNLLTERFMRYIAGGSITGNNFVYKGARDKTPPKEKIPMLVLGNVYMSGYSDMWGGGGYAFYDPTIPGEVRMAGWLITVDQFYDVVAQENDLESGSVDELALSEMGDWGEKIIPYGDEYSRIISLPLQNGFKCFTFTSPKPKSDMILSSAPPAYYDVIMRGLMETFPSEEPSVLKSYLDSINTM